MKTKEINIGKEIQNVCKQRGYTLSEVAQKIGISRQTFNGWLKKDDMRVKDLFAVSEAVGYDFVALFNQPAGNDGQCTKVVLQIEIEESRNKEVLQYIQDKKLYELLTKNE